MAITGSELVNCLVKKEKKKKKQTELMFKLKQNYYVYQPKGWINVGAGEVYCMNSISWETNFHLYLEQFNFYL